LKSTLGSVLCPRPEHKLYGRQSLIGLACKTPSSAHLHLQGDPGRKECWASPFQMSQPTWWLLNLSKDTTTL